MDPQTQQLQELTLTSVEDAAVQVPTPARLPAASKRAGDKTSSAQLRVLEYQLQALQSQVELQQQESKGYLDSNTALRAQVAALQAQVAALQQLIASGHQAATYPAHSGGSASMSWQGTPGLVQCPACPAIIHFTTAPAESPMQELKCPSCKRPLHATAATGRGASTVDQAAPSRV